MPLVVQLTAEQQIDYARIADELHASGFETEPFGQRTIAVKAAPAAVGASRSGADPLRDPGDRRRRSCAARRSTICAAASAPPSPAAPPSRSTRGWTPAKMEWLLRALAATDCPMSCPHGRPIALHYSTREILKAFHRI